MASRSVFAFMIEKKEAMDNIEEICSVPGVDIVQFGPYDFALSSGFNAVDDMERVRAAERRMIKVALDHGVQPRCELNSAADAQYYLDLGVRHFSLGFELRIMSNFLTNEGQQIRELIEKSK